MYSSILALVFLLILLGYDSKLVLAHRTVAVRSSKSTSWLLIGSVLLAVDLVNTTILPWPAAKAKS